MGVWLPIDDGINDIPRLGPGTSYHLLYINPVIGRG